MIKASLFLSLFLVNSDVVGSEKEKQKEKIVPLSEEFLLFLAEMEEVEGELIHPVDLTKRTQEAKKQNREQSKKEDDGK